MSVKIRMTPAGTTYIVIDGRRCGPVDSADLVRELQLSYWETQKVAKDVIMEFGPMYNTPAAA